MSNDREKVKGFAALRKKMLIPYLESHKDSGDVVGEIIKCHLVTEAILEELIRYCIHPHGEAVLSVGLSYDKKLEIARKLMLLDECPLIDEEIADSLKKLNSLRNKMAHRLNYQISEAEIKALFVGLEKSLPYENIFDLGYITAIKRYSGFIYGSMLPKIEFDE